MSQIIDLSGPQLEKKLGRVVGEMELVIAKNLALGVTPEQLCDILGNGIGVDEIQQLRETESFQELYGVIANYLLSLSADTAIGWDQVEAESLKHLMREARVNRDPEFQLRLAAVANKAQRRHNKGEQILEPGAAGTRVQISLSQKFIKKLNGETEIVERRVDLTKMQSPTLDQVNRALQAPLQPGAREVVPMSHSMPRPIKPAVQELDGDAALAAVLKAMGVGR